MITRSYSVDRSIVDLGAHLRQHADHELCGTLFEDESTKRKLPGVKGAFGDGVMLARGGIRLLSDVVDQWPFDPADHKLLTIVRGENFINCTHTHHYRSYRKM